MLLSKCFGGPHRSCCHLYGICRVQCCHLWRHSRCVVGAGGSGYLVDHVGYNNALGIVGAVILFWVGEDKVLLCFARISPLTPFSRTPVSYGQTVTMALESNES